MRAVLQLLSNSLVEVQDRFLGLYIVLDVDLTQVDSSKICANKNAGVPGGIWYRFVQQKKKKRKNVSSYGHP